MSNFAKWSSEGMPNKPIYGVYFASRNKDTVKTDALLCTYWERKED